MSVEQNTTHASEAVNVDDPSSNEELGNELSILSKEARHNDNFFQYKMDFGLYHIS